MDGRDALLALALTTGVATASCGDHPVGEGPRPARAQHAADYTTGLGTLDLAVMSAQIGT